MPWPGLAFLPRLLGGVNLLRAGGGGGQGDTSSAVEVRRRIAGATLRASRAEAERLTAICHVCSQTTDEKSGPETKALIVRLVHIVARAGAHGTRSVIYLLGPRLLASRPPKNDILRDAIDSKCQC